MAHFAELNENNVVLRVVVINNFVITDAEGNESERMGIKFCEELFTGKWIQTSYNKNFRKNFAVPGGVYDVSRDAFINPQPFDNWVLNQNTLAWEPPIPYPMDGKEYWWDQDTTSWIEVFFNGENLGWVA